MKQIIIQYHKSSIGELIIGSIDKKLCLLDFRYRKMRSTVNKRLEKGLDAQLVEGVCDTNQRAIKQLNEFLLGQRQQFDLPLQTVGSEFQEKVWRALLTIPYGQTCSYAQLAETIGDVNAVRAVASANGANAIAVVIPCHRVIGSDGSLTGYAGGLNAKKILLNLETEDLLDIA